MTNKTMMMVELDEEMVKKLQEYLAKNPVDAKTLMNIALHEFFYQSEKKRKAA